MSKKLIEKIRSKKCNATDEQKRMDELEAEIEQCCTGESIAFATHRKQLAAAQKRIDDLERRLKSEERLSFRHQLEESQAREALKQKRIEYLEQQLKRDFDDGSIDWRGENEV